MSEESKVIDIEPVGEETPVDEGEPVKVDPTDPLGKAIGELLNASTQLLTAVLQKGDTATATKKVTKKAIDAAIEIVKKKEGK